MTLSRTRQPIKLLKREPAAGAACSVAGWGAGRQGKLSPALQELAVTVLDARMCNNSRFWDGEIAPTMICFQGRRGSSPSKVRSWGGDTKGLCEGTNRLQSSVCPPLRAALPGCGGLQGGCSPRAER